MGDGTAELKQHGHTLVILFIFAYCSPIGDISGVGFYNINTQAERQCNTGRERRTRTKTRKKTRIALLINKAWFNTFIHEII